MRNSILILIFSYKKYLVKTIYSSIKIINYKFVFRLISGKSDPTPIEVKTHPFQQTSQPQEFNIGTASCALFIGMDFVLLPITLAVDMVYDREVKVFMAFKIDPLIKIDPFDKTDIFLRIL